MGGVVKAVGKVVGSVAKVAAPVMSVIPGMAPYAGIAAGVGGLLGGSSQQQYGGGNVAGGAFYDPFGPYRQQYANQLNSLMANPSSVTSMPGYQFGMQQGREQLERTAAATGQSVSGAEHLALEQFGQQYAGSFLQNQIATLSGLAGAGQGPQSMTGASQFKAQQDQSNWQAIAQGVGALGQEGIFGGTGGIFGRPNPSTPPYVPAGYGSGSYGGPGINLSGYNPWGNI